ncbi:oxidoreductase, short-chain dehydrogenase/reductase family [Metarhizium album ARSEF 1941]|uniref:Oxidoreductase, short-chain dehydrogenase/reductase family n=1 Tax=Metarhizium album (strain ARSEF 1941) TaxID=1081103 RepID=A0A0B2WVJ3_METAS|nr:oxidoreductase, short-chain dehydrogenase/reductase family [Metarhizium album ARSEF 1941]KHN97472.1 oxidoreductase, short-chain dehydrogenase/reductase family [Metarhizium album ARSEF 1941]
MTYRGHHNPGIDLGALRDARQFPILGLWVRYGLSKLANILFTRELGRRYPKNSGVAVHPEVAETDLVYDLTFWKRLLVRATGRHAGEKMQSGAATICNKAKAAFFVPVGVADADDAKCWDDELMAKLWDWTVSKVGVNGSSMSPVECALFAWLGV